MQGWSSGQHITTTCILILWWSRLVLRRLDQSCACCKICVNLYSTMGVDVGNDKDISEVKYMYIESSRSNSGNTWSSSNSDSAGHSADHMMGEAVSKADKIRASQGYHEVEVSCTEEVGLQQCLIRCRKNPRHQNFIPVNEFNIEHLPACYRDNDIVKMVRAMSDLTCRLSVRDISEDRPDTWPGTDVPFPFSAYKGHKCTITGTGWICRVHKYTEEDNRNCECEDCCGSSTHTPKKTWGEFYIGTAFHVVCNDEEARNTKCQFFYDLHETDIKNVLTLTGLTFLSSYNKGDWCRMRYVTHDVELVDKFNIMWRRCWDLRDKMYNMHRPKKNPGVECDTNVSHDLCIVVSHPHGCSKQISIGTWTHRQLMNKDNERESITYNYNTPTCPGSSGAPVITLMLDKRGPGSLYLLPPHSQGRPGNDNSSGVGTEYIYSRHT